MHEEFLLSQICYEPQMVGFRVRKFKIDLIELWTGSSADFLYVWTHENQNTCCLTIIFDYFYFYSGNAQM